MEILIFIYNIFLIVLYTVVVTFSLINYRQKKRQLFAVTAVLFLFYIFDNIIIYMTEFLDVFSANYNLQFMSVPSFKTLIFLVTAYCLVSIQRLILPGRRKGRDTAALVLLGLSLLFIPMAGNGALKVWLYYLPAQLFTLYLSTSGLLYLRQSPDCLDKEMAPYKRLLWITVIFSLLIIIEDTIVIFSFDTYSDIMVKINNRSLSEDILSIIYAVFATGYLTRQLQIPSLDAGDDKASAEAEASAVHGASAVPEASAIYGASAIHGASDDTGNAVDPGQSPAHTFDQAFNMPFPQANVPVPVGFPAQILKTADPDTAFLHFASQYQLTSREQDILRILLADKNNQEISDALFISIGTVKTHVHNIFQKVNVTKRSQLLKIYYEYQRDMPWR